MVTNPYLLVSGCSHTAGVGIDKDGIWANLVAENIKLELVNLARGGACAKFVASSLINCLESTTVLPELVIAQWPNPYRSMKIFDQTTTFYNVNTMDDEFQYRIIHDSDSFLQEWYDSIVELNSRCPTKLINICLESRQHITTQLISNLKSKHIVLHIDEKIPGKTWHFDSRASDRLHHSAECHRKWAERILTILTNTV
jgi:hypothetical protein